LRILKLMADRSAATVPFRRKNEHFRPIPVMAQPLLRLFGDGPVAGLMGNLGSHPAVSPVTARHPRRPANLKSLALPANPWDDAFG
jgi:hypothetical protein